MRGSVVPPNLRENDFVTALGVPCKPLERNTQAPRRHSPRTIHTMDVPSAKGRSF